MFARGRKMHGEHMSLLNPVGTGIAVYDTPRPPQTPQQVQAPQTAQPDAPLTLKPVSTSDAAAQTDPRPLPDDRATAAIVAAQLSEQIPDLKTDAGPAYDASDLTQARAGFEASREALSPPVEQTTLIPQHAAVAAQAAVGNTETADGAPV